LAICDDFRCKDIFSVYWPQGPVRAVPNRLASLALGVTLALLLTISALSAGQATRTVSVRGAPAQPGSILEITLHGLDGDRAPEGTAFGRPLAFYPTGAPHTWRALAGVDVAQKPRTETFRIHVATAAGRELAATGTISMTARAFPTRRLRVASQFVDPSPAELERIRTETQRLDAIFATVTVPDRLDSFAPPLPGVVASNFGTRSIFNGEPRAPHAGADYRGAAGTPISAPGSGRVVLAESLFFTGNTVVIDHGLGLYSLLAHLSRIDVHAGDAVERDAVVGLLGATGRVTGPHLHWGVRLGEARVDPQRLLALLGPAHSGALPAPGSAGGLPQFTPVR
jgi:murein DD-endopeptidase MepM/ murein hydrolase activator NlpD